MNTITDRMAKKTIIVTRGDADMGYLGVDDDIGETGVDDDKG